MQKVFSVDIYKCKIVLQKMKLKIQLFGHPTFYTATTNLRPICETTSM